MKHGLPHCRATGKVRFHSEEAAERILRVREEKRRGEQRSYECSECRGWHLTSMRDVPAFALVLVDAGSAR